MICKWDDSWTQLHIRSPSDTDINYPIWATEYCPHSSVAFENLAPAFPESYYF